MGDAHTPDHPRFEDLFAREFGTLPELVAAHARERPRHLALIQDDAVLDYRNLDWRVDRVAASLARDGIGKGDVVAICAASSIDYAVVFLGTLRAGAAVSPLAPSSTAQTLVTMIGDCGAKILFLDVVTSDLLGPLARALHAKRVSLDGSSHAIPLEDWFCPQWMHGAPAVIEPDDPFNIIYSSGTTGAPKGIVQPHAMRWHQFKRIVYGGDAVTMISTPLYSNTTLVSFLPTLATGGTVVLIAKFDAGAFLRQAELQRATHAMLVPVQYRRIMARPDFDGYDLASFVMKFSTSAPFSAELMADVLKRWPGGLVEFYGMTEGGGSCRLVAHDHPDKLHTVGQPMPDSDIRLVDEEGREVAAGEVGEVVGRSPSMMVGYHNKPEQTREAEWISPDGLRYIRTGDTGCFDSDGFLVLMDRKKDMIISGGFNIYPSDLEAVLAQHPAVLESAVVGLPSEQWGETPVAFVHLRPGADADAATLKTFVNEQVGKTQRLADLRIGPALPRSAIGKVLKRELRATYLAQGANPVEA